MRIALFTETFLPRSDGIVTRLTHTIKALYQSGDEVLVIAPRLPGLPAHYLDAEVIGVPCMPFPLYQGFYLGSPLLTRKARRALRRFGPEVVHTVNPFAIGPAALRYAARQNIPLVASYHTNIPDYARLYNLGFTAGLLRWYMWQLHNKALLNLCTSHTMQAQLLAQGMRRVEVWGPGVDAELFHPMRRSATWRSRLTDGCPEKTILLYVGRLAPEKGLEQILAVLPHVANCHAAFVGDGPQATTLQRAAAGMPVTFLGSLHGQELAAAYASADIFVFPSATETLGLVAMEAMAAGLPVVGARRGGLLDLIVDGETGLFFEPECLEDLTRALNELVDHPDVRLSMAAAARQRAEGWNWSSATAGLRQQYARLLNLKLHG